jgi:N1-aminopropylagmatine ureohydrolase
VSGSEAVAPGFGGLDPALASLEKARIVMVPVPYDSTASYQKGTAAGPEAIIEASRHMELYDEELGIEPAAEVGIHTAPPVSGNEDPPEVMAAKVEEAVGRYLAMGKMPVVLGGEHSVSIGAIRAYEKKYPRLSVVQLDAHGDLRESFEGSPYNHACIMRHFAGRIPTLQIGIRSMSKEEGDFIREHGLMVVPPRDFIRNPESALKMVDRLTDEIYLTIDVDFFDPAIVPGTGTPEPGGPGWHETLDFIRGLCRRRKVVGFDVNELRPIPGDATSDFLVAKLVYKVIAYRFFREGRRID